MFCLELYGLLDDDSKVKLGWYGSSLQMFHIECSKKKDVKVVVSDLRRCSACGFFRKSRAYGDSKDRLVLRYESMTEIDQICERAYLSNTEVARLRLHIGTNGR